MKSAIYAILVIMLFLPFSANAYKKHNTPIQPKYMIDPDVLKQHEARFGRSTIKHRATEDNHGRLKNVPVPDLTMPSFVFSEPGEKNLGNGGAQDASEFPSLPRFPEDNPYQPHAVPMCCILSSTPIERPPLKLYQWGLVDVHSRGPQK